MAELLPMRPIADRRRQSTQQSRSLAPSLSGRHRSLPTSDFLRLYGIIASRDHGRSNQTLECLVGPEISSICCPLLKLFPRP